MTLKKLRATRKVQPGKHGSVKESKRYGSNLLAVRYYKDNEGRYIKTAEIIISERRE